MENRENLVAEIDHIVRSLKEYQVALEQGDAETLTALLKDGSDRKERIDSPYGED